MNDDTQAQTDYTPVSCERHGGYERLVMAGQLVQVSWRDATGRLRLATALPRDVITRDGAEYLVVECRSGEALDLRLDRIVSAEPMGGSAQAATGP